MNEYVIGVDLGTSAVKVSAMDRDGKIVAQQSYGYDLHQPHPGYSEQDPRDWLYGTTIAIDRLILRDGLKAEEIDGISFSGQMHGLVLLDANGQVLRPAMLWNDTRTTKQCEEIKEKMGDKFIEITGNRALEGFTLPKLLWVKENEPEIWTKAKSFLLPKDYVRYVMTGKQAIDYSDATGTVLFDIKKNTWNKEICDEFGIPMSMCPPLIRSIDEEGTVTDSYSMFSGLKTTTKVFGGGGDNACGAVGAGILKPNMVMSSIGTSGVVLKYEPDANVNYHGALQYECHAIPDTYYSMGVTLAAGHSLNWFKHTFAKDEDFTAMVNRASERPLGANGLIFTPYLVGERTPYADADVRGSFIGVDSMQNKYDFVRSVIGGITFSFRDILNIYDQHGQDFDTVVAIGGGAKSEFWLQLQANIFNKKVVSLTNEQGPGLGAAMLAAVGLGWFDSLQDCAKKFVHFGKTYEPQPEIVAKYNALYKIYHRVYDQTKDLSHDIMKLRNSWD